MKKFLLWCGIAAPVAYVAAVSLGGSLRPEYSHIAQPVSSLIETGAPNKSMLDPMFALYNLLTLAFGIGLLQFVRAENLRRRNLFGTLGAVFLMIEGVVGFATLFFPQDPGGAPTTFTGTMHVILAGFCSLASMLTILLMGFWLRATPQLESYGTFSFISVLVIFLSGGLAAVSVATNSPFGGLVERITIGGFLLWLFVIALKLYSMQGTRQAELAHAA